MNNNKFLRINLLIKRVYSDYKGRQIFRIGLLHKCENTFDWSLSIDFKFGNRSNKSPKRRQILNKRKANHLKNKWLAPCFVPRAGVEPARVLPHWCLRPTRLPIPPSGLEKRRKITTFVWEIKIKQWKSPVFWHFLCFWPLVVSFQRQVTASLGRGSQRASFDTFI